MGYDTHHYFEKADLPFSQLFDRTGLNLAKRSLPSYKGIFRFTKRLEPDYFSHMSEYMVEMVKAFQKMGTFWQIPRD